jgi:hypothetical protein
LRMHIREHPKEQEVHVWCASLILLVLHDVNSCQASLQIFICRGRLKQCFAYKSATILHGFLCCWTQKTWTWVDRSQLELHHITECDAGFFKLWLIFLLFWNCRFFLTALCHGQVISGNYGMR